jgi:4-oxalocrotonate tautomerase
MCAAVVGRTMAAQAIRPNKEDSVQLIQVKVIQGVFTAPQKREIIARLTDAMVAIEGEEMRPATWCLIEEIASGEWGVGGQTITTDDARALARGGTEGS